MSSVEISHGPRLGYMVYGTISYLIGVAGLMAIILGAANVIPLGRVLVFTDSFYTALLANICLILLFGLQHSVMARPAFKARFNRFFGAEVERSTYIWSSGVVSIIMIAFWQPVGNVVLWQASSGVGRALAWSIFVFGWSYLFVATFAINHFDLFGLRHSYLAMKDVPYTPVSFKEGWMYRFSRHPIMLGALIGLWAAPAMTGAHFTLAAAFSIYIIAGLRFEEADLVKVFGEDYLAYKKRVGALFTFKISRP